MSQRPYLLRETNWATVRSTDYDIAVLPWGATEAHNYHLPYATDTIQCDYVAEEAAQKAWDRGTRALVLPTVPFGVNTGHMDIPGVVNMHPSTQAAVLDDVVESLVTQGFQKLILLNGHGGNTFKPLVREVQAQYDDLFICIAHWFEIGNWAEYFDDLGDHAGEMETSVMLNAAPELVRPLDEAGDGSARAFSIDALRSDWAWAERQWTAVTEDTGVGNPEAATKEKGADYLETVTQRLSTLFQDVANADLENLYTDAPAP